MSSLALFTLTLLGVTFGNPFDPLVERAQCNYDNCLRVMTNTPLVASSFCSTYLQSTSYSTVTPTVTISGSSTIYPTIPTTTVGPVIPTHISSQCTLTSAPPLISRLSSACSCISIIPAAGTVTLTSYAPAVTDTISLTPPVVCDGVTSPYTANGKPFDLACNTLYTGSSLGAGYPIGGEYWIGAFASCIYSCATTDNCVAATVFNTGSELICDLLGDIDGVDVYSEHTADSAVLESYVSSGGGLSAPVWYVPRREG